MRDIFENRNVNEIICWGFKRTVYIASVKAIYTSKDKGVLNPETGRNCNIELERIRALKATLNSIANRNSRIGNNLAELLKQLQNEVSRI